MSKLYFRYGAMNCGKTTQLLQVANNYEELGMKVLILKPAIDTKGADTIVSRLGVSRKVDYLIDKDTNILELLSKDNRKINCILVDEVQFLSKEQIDQLMTYVVSTGIPIICYGLRTDFRGEGFEGSTRLLQIAHDIEEIKTMCSCGKKAIYNIRVVNGKPVFKGEQVCIDNQAEIKYESVCAGCFYTLKRIHDK